MSDRITVGSDVEFIRYLKEHGGDTMKKCYQCATCSVACQLSPKDYSFPRKEMIQASWGLKDQLLSDPDVWLCHGCMDCSQQCPRGAKPADLMAAVRALVFKNYAVPKFMGEALSKPKYLPYMFLVSIFAILLLVLSTNAIYHNFDMKFNHVVSGKLTEKEFIDNNGSFADDHAKHHFEKRNGIMTYEEFAVQGGNLSEQDFLQKFGVIQYDQFVKKVLIQVLFISGNLFIFFLAFLGLRNYWNDLNKRYQRKPKMGFIAAAWEVILDFLLHRKFDKCPTNTNRRWGHLYTFYGFLGTMIATGLVVLGEMYEFGILKLEIFHLPYPMGLFHPIKILGMISGIFLFLGLLMLIIKRISTDKKEGKSTYNDWLFLWILIGVAFTGILTVLIRMPFNGSEMYLVTLANTIYFIHLTLVFFLLWFMPYSKFAHMIYRFVGLIYLKMHNRENKPQVFATTN